MFGRNLSIERYDITKIIVIGIISVFAIMFILSIARITKSIIDFNVAYKGKVVKKGKFKELVFDNTNKRRVRIYYTRYYYLILEDEIGRRKKRYCRAASYNLCKIGDFVEKKAGIRNNPTPVVSESPYNSLDSKEEIKKTVSF